MYHLRLLSAALLLGASSGPLLAQTASSSAYGLSVDQTAAVPGTIGASVVVAPVAPSSGSAPPDYNVSNSVASVNGSANLFTAPATIGQQVGSGLITTSASGTASAAQATATTNDFLYALTGLSSLLNVSATTIQSFSQANSAGGLDASGSTLIEGLLVSGSLLGGATIDGSLFVNPSPNTILFSGGGIEIILNEQIFGGDGISGTGITTNALRIGFDQALLGTGLVNGDIIVGHTEAFASVGGAAGAVPEPSTWAMMLLGFGAVGASLRRSKMARMRISRA